MQLDQGMGDREDALHSDGLALIADAAHDRDTQLIRERSKALLSQAGKNWKDHQAWRELRSYTPAIFKSPGRDTIFFDFLGIDHEVDDAIAKVMQDSRLLELITRYYNGTPRLWQSQIRRAEPGSRALKIHRDRLGELVTTILLDDVTTPRDAMLFIPGSHNWPEVFSPRGRINPLFMVPAARPATGRSGDAYLFNGRLWHGRRSPSLVASTAIILSFKPDDDSEQRQTPNAVRQLFERQD